MSRLARGLRRIVLTILMGWGISLLAVIWWGKRDSAGTGDVIVVLGAAQYAGRPSPVLRARLDHAYDLWKTGIAPRVLLTGGKGDGDFTSEAEAGRAYLEKRGVPNRAMLLESSGRSTEESVDGVEAIMHREHLERAILVSDPFHMLRLQILSWERGLTVRTSPTRTSPISAKRDEALWYVLGESLKVPAAAILALGRSWRA